MQSTAANGISPGQTGRTLRLFDPDGGGNLVLRRIRLLAAGWRLSVSGELELGAWRELVLDALRQRYESNQGTAEKAVSEAVRLLRYLDARGVADWSGLTSELLDSWFWAARPDRWGLLRVPAESTAKNRQWAAKVALEEAAALGAPVEVDALVTNRIPRRASKNPTRPLTYDEARLVEAFAVSGFIESARPLLAAFAFAGGTAAEIAAVRAGDVDLRDATITYRGPAARANPLGGWAQRTVARFFEHNPPSRSQCPFVRVREDRRGAGGPLGDSAARGDPERRGDFRAGRGERPVHPPHHRPPGARNRRDRGGGPVLGVGVARHRRGRARPRLEEKRHGR